MHTARLETVRASASVATTRYCSGWSQMNKSPVIATRCQFRGGGSQVSCPEGNLPDLSWGGGPYYVTYPIMHLVLPPCEQTDACDNITFP